MSKMVYRLVLPSGSPEGAMADTEVTCGECGSTDVSGEDLGVYWKGMALVAGFFLAADVLVPVLIPILVPAELAVLLLLYLVLSWWRRGVRKYECASCSAKWKARVE